jgi:hypothetical protein
MRRLIWVLNSLAMADSTVQKKNRFLGRNSKSEHAENPTPLSEKNKNGYKRPELRV